MSETVAEDTVSIHGMSKGLLSWLNSKRTQLLSKLFIFSMKSPMNGIESYNDFQFNSVYELLN